MNLITSAELAEAIGVSLTQIDRDRAAGALPEGRKLGRAWVYPASAVETYRAWRQERADAQTVGHPRKGVVRQAGATGSARCTSQ